MDLSDFTRESCIRLKMELVLEDMDPDTRTIVIQALKGRPEKYPARTIAATLSRNNWRVSADAVKSWRDRHVETVQDG